MSKYIEFTDFDVEVCQSAVRSCAITDVGDLEKRWDDDISDWFFDMDFNPSCWYADLHYLLAKGIIQPYKR